MSGSLPGSIGGLKNVQELWLDNNQFSGAPPDSTGYLPRIIELYLSNNHFSGSVPSSFGNLSTMWLIKLSYNDLTGSIPKSLFSMKSLSALILSYNHLSETENVSLPVDFYFLPYVDHNRFTFNGLEYIASLTFYGVYLPQASIPLHTYQGGLSVSAGGTLSNNTYTWHQVGGSSTTIQGDSTFVPSVSGQYFATITNSVATKLRLNTDTLSYTAPPFVVMLPVEVYPNPIRNNLALYGLNDKQTCKVVVTDESGHAWLTGIVKEQAQVKYDVSRLKAGNHVVHIANGQNVVSLNFLKL